MMPIATIIMAAFMAFSAAGSFSGSSRFRARDSFRETASQSSTYLASESVNRTRVLVDEVIGISYPELKSTDVHIKPFRSQSDYFNARFGILQYFFARMRFLLFVNPRVFELQAPQAGVRAIIAHELGHVLYYKGQNRLRLLGLVRISSSRFSARFERWADLKAISRGYGEGLKEYRRWLYANVPAARIAEKRRNYFSPDEIDAILSASGKRPELLEYWLRHVPLTLDQILAATR